MHKPKTSQNVILVYSFVVVLCSVFLLIGMILSPSERENSFILGLSLSRLVVASGFLVTTGFFVALGLKGLRDAEWAARFLEKWFGGTRLSKAIAWLAGISLGLGWIGCFLPAYRAGVLGAYWGRIQPIMVFLLCAGFATLTVFLIRHRSPANRDERVPGAFRLTALLFTVSLLLLGFMLISKYGLYAPEDFWYGAGVPVLTLQLIVSIFAGILFSLMVRKPDSKRTDIAVCILLFVVTAAVWAGEPLQKSFLFTEPRPPNQMLYPFADSAAFDVGSQFALIGQGIYIFNSPFNDRPLYLSLLVYLHSLFGQNYELLMAAQAVLFAVLSPLIYLIGKSLNMRAVGFSAAVVAMLRGINSIAASSMIDMANPKMILSDFPAALGVALIILLTCEWLKKPEQKWQYTLWLGGAIGLTLMIRPHALVILVFLPFYTLLRFAPQWRKWLFACMLIGLGLLAVTLPWELRNVARGGIMYRSIVIKIEDVIKKRYVPSNDAGRFPRFTLQSTGTLTSLYQPLGIAQEQPCNSLTCFAPKHFVHNTVMSILSLPTSAMLDDLRHTVKGNPTFWRAGWDGNFTPLSLLFFLLNVFLILLGVSVTWKHCGLVGLVPLAVFAIYNLSNAAARTSGGRYIVPADWIISIYYLAGILYLFQELAVSLTLQLSLFYTENQEYVRVSAARSQWLTTFLVFSMLLAVGSVIPLSEKLHSPRYAEFNATNALHERETQLTKAGLDIKQIDAFLNNPGAEALVGRTLYPRSYKMGQGEVTFYFYPFTVMDFPRTGFFLIGPNGQNSILLPGGVPKQLPHAADALVIGCRGENYFDALIVVVLDQTDAVYARSPMSGLTCPLPQPVCENNNLCR